MILIFCRSSNKGRKEILATIKQLFDSSFLDHDEDNVQELVGRRWLEVTNKYLSNSSWPSVEEEDVQKEIEGDEEFSLFYRFFFALRE